MFQYILKGQAERDAEGEKDRQAWSSQREQGDPEMDPEAEEDQVITEKGEPTDQERENDKAAAATHSSTGFDLGNKDTLANAVNTLLLCKPACCCTVLKKTEKKKNNLSVFVSCL